MRGHGQAYANEIMVVYSKTLRNSNRSMGMHKGYEKDVVRVSMGDRLHQRGLTVR